jgi:MFS-type transporter involved in bile tolerance (Atg22 family)
MASNDPGLATVAAPAEDPLKGAVVNTSSNTSERPASSAEEIVATEEVIAPDQFDERYTTTRNETWAYYSYYIGNNGLSLFNFAPTAAQNLLYQHAEAIGGPDNTIVNFAGADRTINGIILLCNGISFAIQAVLFLIIGAYADFGTFRPNILIGLSLVAWGIGFGWLGVHEEPLWQHGLGLYIVGLIAYQLCLTYWTAAFPGLARNTPEMRAMAEKFEDGACSRDEYNHADSMKRNELSNVAFYVQSVAELVILAVIVGVMFGLNVNDSVEANNYGLSVLIAFASGVWILVALPWFWLEKRRPGQDPGMNIVVAGLWQLRNAMTQVWQLRQSLFYLIGESGFTE